MSINEGERKFTTKRGIQKERVKDREKEAERGLKSRNALTLETWVCVSIWHSTSCHSTGLSTHTHTHPLTHTHTVYCGGWFQEATPGEENTFQGAINPPPPHLQLASQPASQKCPPSLPLALSAYLHQSQHAGAGEPPSHTHWELRHPGLPTGHNCSRTGWKRLKSLVIHWPAGCQKPPGWPGPPQLGPDPNCPPLGRNALARPLQLVEPGWLAWGRSWWGQVVTVSWPDRSL